MVFGSDSNKGDYPELFIALVHTAPQIIPREQQKRSKGMMFRNLWKIKFGVSVTTISSYCFKARGLKFDMKINVVKLVGQIFEFLSWKLR